ncbi:MAG TPA: AsmA family protein [Burkholderiaceae bacterium]|jgi:AsmA protein
MPKIVKYVAIAIGVSIALLLIVIGIVAATFNPNDYKPLIIKLVQEKKERTLSIPGDIKLTFFPKIGADLGKISLSEHKSSAEFASINSAKVSLALWPLLSKNLVVDRIVIDGLSANLKRFKDGTTNIDDLLSKDQSSGGEQIKFAIDSVHVSNARVVFDGQQQNRKVELANVNIDTDEVANNVPSKLSLSADIKNNQPNVAVKVIVKTGFTFDMDQKHYVLKGLDAAVNGALLDYTDVALKAAGDVDLKMASEQFALDGIALSASARHAGQIIDAKFDVPKLAVTNSKVSGAKISGQAKLTEGAKIITAEFSAPSFDGTPQAFKVSDLTLNAGIKDATMDMKAKVTGMIAGDLDKQTVAATLKGNLDESAFDAKLGVVKFSPLALTFDVGIDKLDVDRYQSKSTAAATPQKAEPEKPLDLSSLKTLNAKGSLKVGALKVENIKASNVRIDINAADGKVEVNPLAANLYGGSVAGSMTLTATSTPHLAMRQKLTSISVGPLLKDAIDKEPIDGKGDVQIDVTTQGAMVSQMKKVLAGTAQLELRDGAIHGINLAQMIRDAKAKLSAVNGGTQQTGTSSAGEKTDFSELKASFRIANGIAHNDDLSAKSPLIRVGGAGDIDIANERLDYLVKATVVSTLQGQGGPELQALKGVTIPVKLTGPFTAIGWKIDFDSMVNDLAKQKLDTKKEQIKEEAKTKVEQQLKEGLKGLFGK